MEDKKWTTEQAERLLKAIFDENEPDKDEPVMDDPDDNYPDTIAEKIDYAEYVAVHTLTNLAPAINRLGRLNRLLTVGAKGDKQELPNIITHNEARMALQHLIRVESDIKEITQMVMDVYNATKVEKEQEAAEKEQE